jgi:hypothetical protein
LNKARETGTDLLSVVRAKKTVSVRKVASFVGQIISMSTVIGSVCQLMTKCLSIDILNAISWNKHICLSADSIRQILFWIDNIQSINVKKLSCQPSCEKIVYPDASGYAFGGYCVESRHSIAHGMWNSDEACQSSTWRELVAVLRVLLSLNHELSRKKVKWFTDNKNIVSIVNKGGMKENLQSIALDIYKSSFQRF